MKIINTVRDMQAGAEVWRREGKVIGFVPTMGYLHEGHLSLIRLARKRAGKVVVSIFVNPLQFGPNEDLDQYPRDFAGDEQSCDKAGTDLIFYPPAEEMYPDPFLSSVQVKKITDTLCGASRPGHFLGVTTVCAKLFHAVKPHFAVFGEKDFQQAAVIRQMVRDLNFDLEIVTGPIIREPDGLAMSSRNKYLSAEERKDALVLNQALGVAESRVRQGERSAAVIIESVRKLIGSRQHTRIDYVDMVHPDTLEPVSAISGRALLALAVFVGRTRLIDNRILTV